MLALPPAPAPAKPRMMLVGTALACAGAAVLIASILGVYLHYRDIAGGTTGDWLPSGVKFNLVATQTILLVMVASSVMAQWAVYAVHRGDRQNTYVALGLLSLLFGPAAVNALVFVWNQSGITVRTDDTPYAVVVLGVTGLWLALLLAGIVFGLVVLFRTVGGRGGPKRHEAISSLAMYWHMLAVTYAFMWYVVFVLK